MLVIQFYLVYYLCVCAKEASTCMPSEARLLVLAGLLAQFPELQRERHLLMDLKPPQCFAPHKNRGLTESAISLCPHTAFLTALSPVTLHMYHLFLSVLLPKVEPQFSPSIIIYAPLRLLLLQRSTRLPFAFLLLHVNVQVS